MAGGVYNHSAGVIDFTMNGQVEALSGYATKRIAASEVSTEFDDIFMMHHRAVYRAAYAIVRDPGLAEDVTQEVFLRLYQNLHNTPPEDDLRRAWLLRVAINQARNAVRGRGRATAREEEYETVRATETESAPSPESEYERQAEITSARRTLERIAEPGRSCLLLKQQGFSYRDIALSLSLNEASVGSYVARARKEFARIYGKIGVCK